MRSLAQQIIDLKTEAKNQRDRGLNGYPRALARLNAAIDLARGGLEGTKVADTRCQLTSDLADCFGMMGGVERRWGIESEGPGRLQHLHSSCVAYDQGYAYEWQQEFGTPASYNLTNRLTGRLLIRPDLLDIDSIVDLGHAIEPMNVRRELFVAMDLIEAQLATKNNFWAEADLALLKVLVGQVEVSTAYAQFFALSPPDFAFGSVLDGLSPLVKVNVSTAPSLQKAIELVTSKRPQ